MVPIATNMMSSMNPSSGPSRQPLAVQVSVSTLVPRSSSAPSAGGGGGGAACGASQTGA